MSTTQDRINIKGTASGVIITIGSGNWQGILDELEQKLSQRASFFKGGRVALEVGNRLLNEEEIEAVGTLLYSHQMTLWAVSGIAAETRQTAAQLGLEPNTSHESRPVSTEKYGVGDIFHTTHTVERTLRSGQTVQYPGNVVILGDVNPGAEIVAGGHVIVWGRLRGSVRAGTSAIEGVFVCALTLQPTHLAIGDLQWTPEKRQPKGTKTKPTMISVAQNELVTKKWA